MKARDWLNAARPPTLWAGVAPVVVGTVIAVGDGVFRFDVFTAALVAAVAIQIGVNYANDVADATRGADPPTRIGPRRAVASGLISGRAMWRGVAVAFGIAGIAGVYLSLVAGPLPQLMGLALVRRLMIRGFIVFDHAHLEPDFIRDVGGWIRSGALKYREDVVEGLDNAVGAFLGLLRGENFGKLLVRVSDDPTR